MPKFILLSVLLQDDTEMVEILGRHAWTCLSVPGLSQMPTILGRTVCQLATEIS